MLLRLSTVCSVFALLHTQALADSQYLGTKPPCMCADGGEDLCSNTLKSAPINLKPGPFTEDFVFDFVNDFGHYPDDIPLLQAKALLTTDSSADVNSGDLQLYDSSGTPFGFEIMPFIFNGSGYSARSGNLIYPGVGYYAEVTGVSSSRMRSPLQLSISASDSAPSSRPSRRHGQ